MKQTKLPEYQIVNKIGNGSFGEIFKVNLNKSGNIFSYAMKKLSKKQLHQLNKIHQPEIEREILRKLNQINPDSFVLLHEVYNENDYTYMILELCENGSFDTIINKLESLPNKSQVIKRIIVKMVNILEILHSNKIVHRDLKPSNFLLLKNGTIKLADFGTASADETIFSPQIASSLKASRQISKKKQSERMGEMAEQKEKYKKRSSFVGTPLYMAPQLLQEEYCGFEADLWALGCIIYEMMHGKNPFNDLNEGIIWKKITSEDFSHKQFQNSTNQQEIKCGSLIKSLLVKQRTNRLGSNGYAEIRKHPYFQGVNWEMEVNRPIKQIEFLCQKRDEQSLKSSMSFKKKDAVLFSGVVTKESFIGWKERLMTLLSTPKLQYFDMETGEKKGEIILLQKTPYSFKGGKTFTVTNPKKTYIFKTEKAQEWVQMIKSAIIGAYF